MRRRSIAPFFSAAKIGDFEPVIREKCGKLCERLAEYQKTGSVVRFGRAWMALTTDIITQYSFGRSYDQLQSPDFEDTLHEALVAIYVTGQFALHFPIVFPILDLLPEWFVKANQPEILPVVGLRKDLAKQVRQIRDAGPDHVKNAKHPTIFHELLNSGLPPEETTDARLGDEAQLIVAAGLITTSWALSVAGYHLTAQPETAAKLRAELAKEAAVMPGGIWDWHRLEKLPYLYAVVHESIRLSHGIVTRDPRLAPDTELRYKEWVIPKNTPVSMTTVDILINESIYPEPKKFKPERWIGNEDKLEKFFVPFGKGTRQCIGIK